MTVFKRGSRWWYEFWLGGKRYSKSSFSANKQVAERAEREHKRDIELGINRLPAPKEPLTFRKASREWLESNPQWTESNRRIERYNVEKLLPTFGSMMLTDIKHSNVSAYQSAQKRAGKNPRAINMKVGTLRAVLRKHGLWAVIQPHVSMLPTAGDIGRSLDADERKKLLAACKESRSRSLFVAVTLALMTGMRNEEIRLLKWGQVDLTGKTLKVGKSKTKDGAGRVVPLNAVALKALQEWRWHWPDAKDDSWVFPSEKVGLDGENGYEHGTVTYNTDPTRPMQSWKIAWTFARKRAGVECRFHDLRHTACTLLLEGGVPFALLSSIMGWSASTTVTMAKRYGHIGNKSLRDAMDVLANE